MLSGWDARAGGPEFRNADGDGVMHFRAHVEAAQYLMGERNAVGIAVDTLSLDYGKSADFATHYAWLPTNRWGLEAVANLAELPPVGATLVAGGPKIKGDRRPEPGARPALARAPRSIGLPTMALRRWTWTRLQIVAVVAVIAGAVGVVISWLIAEIHNHPMTSPSSRTGCATA